MYEGKNIHYSSTDNKLLCSFSAKLCNQRRLNGYGFCVRHILEDPTAPFKRCAYVAKSSNQMCTQAIPKHEERRYCNNHMQVLGMLPKKERKKKEKPPGTPETCKPSIVTNASIIKPKFSLSSGKDSMVSHSTPQHMSIEDPDDPYAFPDSGPSENRTQDAGLGNAAATADSILGKSLQSGQGFVRSASDISSSSMSGGSMIAKYYPELAEKLEKMRAKPEPKVTPKSRARSSRTMNKLQTKIAQNKINEKLRKSQELSQTDSNSSPVQLSSPEQGIGMDHSPSPGPVFSPSSSQTFSPQAPSTGQTFSSALTLAAFEQSHGQSVDGVPPLPQVDTSFLATLAAQDTLGFQNSSASEMAMSSSSGRLLSPHTPPKLPPPYPGSSTLSTPSSLTSSELPGSAFSPQSNNSGSQQHLNAVLEGLTSSPHRHSQQSSNSGSLAMHNALTSTPPRQKNLQSQPAFLSPASSSFPPSNNSVVSSYPFVTNAVTVSDSHNSGVKSLQHHMSSSLAPPNIDIFSLLNITAKGPGGVEQGLQQSSQMLPSPNTLAAHLPPPPPYVPPAVPPKVSSSPASVSAIKRTALSVPTIKPPEVSVLPNTSVPSVPHGRLHKLKGILSEKAAKRKLKSDLAVKFYSFYAKRKISNHCLVGPYLCSSDEESEDDDSGMLPWQPDVFSASSEEEADDDDELENDVPMGMRPTKLSLLKTRLRRQWYQARKASRENSIQRHSSNQATLALIRCVRDSGACAVRALWQIKHVKKSKRKLKKLKKTVKQCCQKNSEDGQCKNPCLPYTNHCLRHIMYNIDQQIFDYCTAKFADNTQCCMPAFDIRHELPLCPEHAAKADNYQKQLEAENKKRPRKKSKPPALTRPPRKGKKKKKGRYTRAQKPVVAAESTGMDSMSDVDVTGLDNCKPEEELGLPSTSKAEESTPSEVKPTPTPTVVPVVATSVSEHKERIDLVEALSPDFEKQFEMGPLEQASRLLEESDLQDVVNKMPFEVLDLFSKNGEPEAEPAESVEQLGVDVTSTTKATLEKLLTGAMSEEESMQLAMVLAQNLQADAELAHGVQGLAEDLVGGPSDQGMGVTSAVHQMGRHGGHVDSATTDPTSHFSQVSAMSSSLPGNTPVTAQMAAQSQRAGGQSLPGSMMADLHSMYGQMDTLTRSQMTNKQHEASGDLNLNHMAPQLGLDTFVNSTTAKTVIRHLPSEAPAVSSSPSSRQNIVYVGGSLPSYPEGLMTSQQGLTSQLVGSRGSAATSATFQTSLSPAMNSGQFGPQQQTIAGGFTVTTSLSLCKSSPSQSYSTALPTSSMLTVPASPNISKMMRATPPQTPSSVINQQRLAKSPHAHIQVSSQFGSGSPVRPSEVTANSLQPPGARKSPNSDASLSPHARLSLPSSPRGSATQLANLPYRTQSGQAVAANTKLNLPSSNLAMPANARFNLPEGQGLLPTSSSSLTATTLASSGLVRHRLTANTSLSPLSLPTFTNTSVARTTSIHHNLLSDSLSSSSNSATESICVTVRHPSPPESVPTTVRHTLPDTIPSPVSLPASPSLLPTSGSDNLNQELTSRGGQSLQMASSLSSLQPIELHPILSNPRAPQWKTISSRPNLQNGSPSSPRQARGSKTAPAGQGNKSKISTEAARLQQVLSAGVPVTLPGFVQSLSTTTFQSTGSS